MSGACLATRGGRLVDLADPKPETIWLDDIAYALARIARFGGHAGGPDLGYSVAQHSVLVMRRLAGASVEVRRLALMHDAAEAYIGDVTRPMREAMYRVRMVEPPLAVIERNVEYAIARRFRLTGSMADMLAVEVADDEQLRVELAVLMGVGARRAGASPIATWTVVHAHREFLAAAREVGLCEE